MPITVTLEILPSLEKNDPVLWASALYDIQIQISLQIRNQI
jgi:hypothetical protein